MASSFSLEINMQCGKCTSGVSTPISMHNFTEIVFIKAIALTISPLEGELLANHREKLHLSTGCSTPAHHVPCQIADHNRKSGMHEKGTGDYVQPPLKKLSVPLHIPVILFETE